MKDLKTVYKIITALENPIHGFNNDQLRMLLLEALGELGYTVPDLAYSGIMQCGLCDAKHKEIEEIEELRESLERGYI